MFYGWKLCFLSMIGNFLLQGSILFMMNAFVDPLCALHGFTRAELSLSMSVGSLLTGLSIPFWSNLCLRYSLRSLMAVGAFLGGTSLIILGFVHSIYAFTIFYSIGAMSGQAFGGVIASVLVNNWFNKVKGRAFGLFNVGISLSGAILPFLLLVIINYFDVRTAFVTYGIVVLFFVPILWIFVRDTPEEMGLYPDGIIPADIDKETPLMSAAQNAPVNVPWGTVLKERDMYLIALIFILSITCGGTMASQLQPHFIDIGLTPYGAMSLSCLIALGFGITKFFWGAACDTYNSVKITRLSLLLFFVSLLLIFLPMNFYTIALFVLCFSMTGGGFWSILPVLVSFYFGKNKFVFYYRAISTFLVLRSLGYLILAISLEYTQAYYLAYVMFASIVLTCFGLSFLLKVEGKAG